MVGMTAPHHIRTDCTGGCWRSQGRNTRGTAMWRFRTRGRPLGGGGCMWLALPETGGRQWHQRAHEIGRAARECASRDRITRRLMARRWRGVAPSALFVRALGGVSSGARALGHGGADAKRRNPHAKGVRHDASSGGKATGRRSRVLLCSDKRSR